MSECNAGNQLNTKVALSLYGFSDQHEMVTQLLADRPDRAANKGDPRHRPKMPSYKRSYWGKTLFRAATRASDFTLGEDDDDAVADWLYSRIEALAAIKCEKQISIGAVQIGDRMPTFHFRTRVVHLISRIGADLDIDIFGTAVPETLEAPYAAWLQSPEIKLLL